MQEGRGLPRDVCINKQEEGRMEEVEKLTMILFGEGVGGKRGRKEGRNGLVETMQSEERGIYQLWRNDPKKTKHREQGKQSPPKFGRVAGAHLHKN